jgi:septal ring factor EnvC (AmiA/AmiB activator)
MISLGLITDFILVALLVATLFYVLRLLRRLNELQKDRDSFQKLIQDFASATGQADRSLAELRGAVDGIGKDLGKGIERGQGVVGELQRSSDDLKMLIARAENAADKLEVQLGTSRQSAASSAPTSSGSGGSTRSAPEPRPVQDAQTQALLSALGRIR